MFATRCRAGRRRCGAGGGSSHSPAAVAQPPTEAPFLKGRIVSITTTEPVTTDCVSEPDADGDGAVSSNDAPVCDPNPTTFGTIHVKGEGGGGDSEIVAGIEKTVPIARGGIGGTVEPITFSDLSEGDTVSLWVDGPLMESFPLQGGASYVLLEE